VLSATQDRHGDRLASRPKSALDHSPQLLRELMARDGDRNLRRGPCLGDVAERHTGSILACLLRLVVDSPVDSLSGLAQPRRAFDEQAPNALPVFRSQPPEEEPLNDLAQPLLGFLSREEGGAGGWRHWWKRAGVARVTGEPCASDRIGRNASGSPA